ncbi:hypothetical protein BDZ97DRAFT_1860264 [Flammula alnicola]|nr:hypothetical protein BDZ97DRAFT_1860264 [Flammula alnicola]
MPNSDSSDSPHNGHISAVFKALQRNKLNAPALRGYIEAARMIPMRVDPFINLERIFFAGVPDALSSEDGTRDDDYTDAEVTAYATIIKLIPSYAKILSACANDPSLFELFIKEVGVAATRSRTNDTSTIKSKITSYVLPSHRLRFLLKKTWHPLDPDTLRGWNDEQCSLLLTPLRLLPKFFEDPHTFMQNVQNGETKIKAKEFPYFLYPEGTVYSLDNEFEGLFRGPLLLRVYRHIFSSPLSAFDKTKRGNKPSQAEKHGITQVEPRGIAYAVLHARMAISGLGWTQRDGFFDNEDFFDNVANMFLRQPESAWAKETLHWWNSEVCLVRSKKNAKRNPVDDDDSDDGLGNPVDRILAQVAAAEEGNAPDTNYRPEPNTASPRPEEETEDEEQQASGLAARHQQCEPSLRLEEEEQNARLARGAVIHARVGIAHPEQTPAETPARTSQPSRSHPTPPPAPQSPAARTLQPAYPPLTPAPAPTPQIPATRAPQAPQTSTPIIQPTPLQQSISFNLTRKHGAAFEGESDLSEEESDGPTTKKLPVPALPQKAKAQAKAKAKQSAAKRRR